MTKLTPYIVFGAAYGILSLLLGALLDSVSPINSLQHLVGPAAAPIALLFAWRFGSLSWPGVLAATALVALGSYAAVVGILHGIAVPAGGSVAFLTPARIGGWPFAMSNALFILSPVIWLHFLGRRRISMRTGGAA